MIILPHFKEVRVDKVACEKSLELLIADFRKTLDNHEELLKSFCRHGVQLEGWLKGELLYFLDNERKQKIIIDFDREVALGKEIGKVDLRLTLSAPSGFTDAWIELKYWLIGHQRGSSYNASFYFGDPTSVGISIDAGKLLRIPNGLRYILVLAVANPSSDDWSTGVEKFNSKFSPLHLTSITDPEDFPESYFLGLLNVASTRKEKLI
ncbi:hypothetical protein MUP01_01470 [Candidatus Bathyarchaeota archaeon]|nr:hypothetical protein [Candidatus Bathyarchaeota archaeon]